MKTLSCYQKVIVVGLALVAITGFVLDVYYMFVKF